MKNVDINIILKDSLEFFSCRVRLWDIFHFDLHDFEYPDGETALTASLILHDDKNPAPVMNEKVKYYTLLA